MDGDRVGVVRVCGVASQLEPAPRRRALGGQRGGVVASRSGHADDPQPELGELRRVATEVATRVAIDELVAGDPHGSPLVGIPVALFVGDVDLEHGRQAWQAGGPRAPGPL